MATQFSGLVSSTLIHQRTRQDSLSVERLSTSAAPFFAAADIPGLNSLLENAVAGTEDRLLLCDLRGKVHCDTVHEREGMRLPLQEVGTVLSQGETEAQVYDLSLVPLPEPPVDGCRYADYAAAPVLIGDEMVGALVLISPVDEVMGSLESVQRVMIVLFVVIALAAVIIAFFFSHVLTRPISTLTKSIQRMGKGDLSVRVPEKGGGELRELAQSYNTMAEQLEQLDKSRNQFVSNASHELKTPLATMKIVLESMLYQPDMPEDMRQEFMGDMNHEIDRMSTVITDLLTLTQMDNKRMTIRAKPVDIGALTEETVHSLMPMAENRGQQLQADTEPGIIVSADADRLGQVFSNLIENALKYTADGGRIRVKLRRKGKTAVWSVTDNGVGIPEADQQHIFERFYRVDKARSRETGGTGLGLSIVRQLVQLHGGKVTVESEPGKGSTFTVTLPVIDT